MALDTWHRVLYIRGPRLTSNLSWGATRGPTRRMSQLNVAHVSTYTWESCTTRQSGTKKIPNGYKTPACLINPDLLVAQL